MNVKTWLADHWEMAIPLVAGACIGWAAHGTKVETRTVTEYKDRVVEHTVTVEKPVVQYRDRVITRIVTKPDGTRTETHVDETSGKTSGGSTTTVDRDRATEGKTSVVQAPEGRWRVGALAGVNTAGGIQAGATVSYRLVGPLEAGVFGLFPVGGTGGPVTVGVSAGLRF